ncbi:MAG: O-methyltransferase [Bryobacterales bacterium]|nr:O-methyltransferase [Bryobacterales bacterium]
MSLGTGKRKLGRRALLLAAPAAGAGLWAQRRFGRRFMESENLPLAGSEAEKRILAVLDEMAREGRLYASVPVSDGRMLRLLTETANAKSVVEIGTSTGYSGLWFCLALQATGGRLTTFEIDPGRAQMARDHFKKAGVDGMVTLVEGDAHQTTARLKEPIDVAFLDADKDGYVAYLNRLLPLVRPGGLILAHNLDMVPDYVREVTSNPRLDTVLYREGGGLAITLKKR